ncbi:hypothetical protein E2C01_056284 [Portunus trituberculatus]|uniref:Uncharacterized protein n=1 Tax=Portunus trituberculatus TaxID=210409 RepID=A0A5B7GPY3_PORTR|nr:hypothetical protein [Portunus trituberculatus]
MWRPLRTFISVWPSGGLRQRGPERQQGDSLVVFVANKHTEAHLQQYNQPKTPNLTSLTTL